MSTTFDPKTSRRGTGRWWLPCLVTATMLSSTLWAATPSGTATVTGIVDLGSGPVANAAVILRCDEDSRAEHSTATETDGSFELAGIALGRVTVLVYDTEETLIAMGTAVLETAGETVTVVLEPPRP